MQRLHITYTQYQAEPFEEMVVFEYFVRGEQEAEKLLKQLADASKG